MDLDGPDPIQQETVVPMKKTNGKFLLILSS